MATVDSIDAFTLLHAMAPMSFDASRLIDMACIAFAGLTMDQIQALRKAYRTTVVASKLNVSAAPLLHFSSLCAGTTASSVLPLCHAFPLPVLGVVVMCGCSDDTCSVRGLFAHLGQLYTHDPSCGSVSSVLLQLEKGSPALSGSTGSLRHHVASAVLTPFSALRRRTRPRTMTRRGPAPMARRRRTTTRRRTAPAAPWAAATTTPAGVCQLLALCQAPTDFASADGRSKGFNPCGLQQRL